MRLRKIVRRILLAIFFLGLAPTVGVSTACLILVGSFMPRGGIQSLGVWGITSPVIGPIVVLSFIGWALLSTFPRWIRLLLVALALVPPVWIRWIAPKPWTESEFSVAAEYNPADQKIYFVSTQEALLDDKPPGPPSRVKADMWLERVNLDGTKREPIARLPAAYYVGVQAFAYRGGRCYASSRDVRLRLSPGRDKIAMEEYWGGLYVVNLADKRVTWLAPRASTNEFRYDHGCPFITWLPDDEHLLLWVSRHQTWNSAGRDAIVSTPATYFRPQELWEDLPQFAVDARGRYSHPGPRRTLLWMGTIGPSLIVYDDPRGVQLTRLDLGHLQVDNGHRAALGACWNIISGPQTNRWLTSEGDIIDEQLRVLKALPDLHGGYRAQRTPHAWCPAGVIITDPAVGLAILNPDTGAARTVLSSRFVHRSRPTDEEAYQSYLRMNAAVQSIQDKIQRSSAEHSQQVKQDETDAANLAEGLSRHDTNALNLARGLLWKNDDAYVIAANRLTAADWDQADDVVSDFILHGPDVYRRCRVVWRVGAYCPDRFSNTLFRVASDLSTNNARVLGDTVLALARVHSPQVESCLVNIALKCPDIRVQYVALSQLYPRNRPLYDQTLEQLAGDKDFMDYYAQQHRKVAAPKQ
ncbi:MAG TPA: hypothetical protein VMV72_16190 [Verrucomicrobiae bacterium]|nr:hypothetical protein [Verrucomicrobiae bacterium]